MQQLLDNIASHQLAPCKKIPAFNRLRQQATKPSAL